MPSRAWTFENRNVAGLSKSRGGSGQALREQPRYNGGTGIIGAVKAASDAGAGHTERQRKEGPPQIFVLGSFFSFFARRDTGEQHDPGGSLSGSILTDSRLERQFSVSDLG